MDKPEPQSKWDELARALGAETPPEPPRREPAPPINLDPPPEPVKARVAPQKRAADWGQLNTELGLPAPPPIEQKLPARELPPVVKRQADVPAAESRPAPVERDRGESE